GFMFGAKRLMLLNHGVIQASDVIDVPETEAAALIWLYENTNGSGWTDNSNWLQTPTVGNWYGITVAGGKVTKIDLDTNNLVGDITAWDFNAFTGLEYLYVNVNANLEGSIDTWTLPDSLIRFYIGDTKIGGDIANLVYPASILRVVINGCLLTGSMVGQIFPASLQTYYGYALAVSGAPDLSSSVGLGIVTVSNCNYSQADVDAWLLAFYNRRMSFVSAAPVLYIHGSNAAPGGIYQAACPPTTGKEYQYELSNDSCGDGFNTWAITANV
ncbi:MAG: hypothetical protein MUO62_18240, partial [Anaerolineales bacterium]|nr:hypothetical protein [Anaerolineales bacterium]